MTATAVELTAHQAAAKQLERVLFEVKRVIVGQDTLVERLLVALLAEGHLLLEGVPGVAKTLAAETLATAVGGTFARIQFTPDLVPSDILGTRVYRASREEFDVEPGPVMANLVLADEINRAPAKVQSALLEVMAERQVSIGGRRHPLPAPFAVLATQNPIESEGVYPLPEAQRDRFLMKVVVGYPTEEDELGILYRMGADRPSAHPVLDPARLVALQRLARGVFVHHALAEYVVRLVMATRNPSRFGKPQITPLLGYGASPRSTLGLVAAARALALVRGRDYVLPSDVGEIAVDVLAHRLVLSFDAVADGVDPAALVRELIAAVPVPRIAPARQDDGHGLGAAA
ncbi:MULTISPECIES: AAA family ATPase [Catenuloplanes]|uniref:MoxR-like ATPase n=1 Tax=Catenuloplanes niger TaxID=587534 RepID=A0AAE4A0W9_9ACTN|nr:MoxR family ATPase [Catenuloplanes niger]MDR7327195.1 MoxR-like ATPase [Catenuloplanes niger]